MSGLGTKVIHFSDGSTMEINSHGDPMEDAPEVSVQSTSTSNETTAEPSRHPSDMAWGEWVKHYSSKGATSVVDGLEHAGETLAYFFGITAPKYQSEIGEYEKVMEKRRVASADVRAWSSTNPVVVPVITPPAPIKLSKEEHSPIPLKDMDRSKLYET